MSAPNQTARPDVPRRRLSDDDLRNLRLLGLVAPVLFIALVIATHPFLVDALGHEHGFNVVGAVMVVAAAAFGWGMYRLIGRAHAEVLAREEALAATQARHQLVTERQAAALTERDRIARELHDSLAQVLGVAHLKLQALAVRPEIRGSERVSHEVGELAELCQDGYHDVREAILGLKDSHQPRPALLTHLEGYLQRYTRLSGIPTALDADDTTVALAPEAEVQVIRIVQEALSNVRKHADASRATLVVRTTAKETTFTVTDDGCGFTPQMARHEDGHGFGLGSMRERAEGFGGRLTLASTPGEGTSVTVAVPAAQVLDVEALSA
ncbi:MAG: sensor histidine kinase [Propionibacteriaceae bacterium]|nr:sensor histidine kinase [Propionibacteriaceae bacterium]